MEYTKNYHLPQWVEEDRILMEDFNQTMANIEMGISAVRTGAGAYTGNGLAADAGGLKVTLGFRPKFIFISLIQFTSTAFGLSHLLVVDGVAGAEQFVTFLDDGFQINYLEKYGTGNAIRINDNGKQYGYMAFQ